MGLAGRGWHGSGGAHLSPTEVAWFLGGILVVLAAVMLVVVVRNARGLGVYRTPHEVAAYARSAHYGDVDRAASFLRTGLPVALTMLAVGADLVILALVGPEDALTWAYWPWPIGVTLVCASWIVVEYELAIPGVLLPAGVRGTSGMSRARRERRNERRVSGAARSAARPVPGAGRRSRRGGRS